HGDGEHQEHRHARQGSEKHVEQPAVSHRHQAADQGDEAGDGMRGDEDGVPHADFLLDIPLWEVTLFRVDLSEWNVKVHGILNPARGPQREATRVTTWTDVINYVRTRYEVLEETGSWLRFRLDTEGGRNQQVAVHHLPGQDGPDLIE